MLVSDLSGQEAIGSNSHGEITSHVLISPLFAPPSSVPRHQEQPKTKKKRSQPGNPDPSAEVIALSPRTLLATNRFVCEICNKGFQRDQNLQLHRRGHNLPWKLRQRSLSAKGDGAAARKRVYVCPEPTCVHHDPARALGDLTGIKKHFSRKHGEKRWRCERCGKQYAVQSDWKAHVKSCGTREYRCDCGILFSRKDSLTTHRVFCDALAEETARLLAATNTIMTTNNSSNNSSLLSLSDPPTALLPASQLSPCLDQLPIAAHAASASPVPNTVNFGVLDGAEDPVALHGTAGRRGLTMTRDFLGVEAGEPELQLPLSAAGRPGCSSTTTSSGGCATGLTMQYFGRLPPANETWSNL